MHARLDRLAERDLEVFTARRLHDDRVRLDDLAERFSVSRERVRQYEARALDDLRSWLAESPDAQSLVDALVRVIGTVRPLTEVIDAVPAAGDPVDAVGLPLWRVLLGIGVPFEVAGAWAAAPTMQAAREASAELARSLADEFGVVVPGALRRLGPEGVPGTGEESSDPGVWAADWAEELGYVRHRDRILLDTATVEDYAAAVLSIHGEPMTPDQIVATFHVERSARSLVNQMTGDERFQRVTRTQWGLRLWGGGEYRSIRNAIGDLLDARGGRIPVTELIDEVSAAYDVKAASVASYACAPPFTTLDGVVSRAEHSPQPKKSTAQTRNLYRVGDAWKLRVTVTREHLRGSGTPLPVALPVALGLEPGETRRLDSPDNAQPLSWTALQPTLGSTRRFYLALGIDEGGEAFFVFTDDGRFDVEPLRAETERLPLLLAAVGLPPTDDVAAALALLATAVGLPAQSSIADLCAALAARGEDALADLLSPDR
ncbi:MAG: sigma factor-like helix-turn-helix DNA-binding protein [Gordonia sp. (in: high G+C Gram-positive bacteria)]|uniref:sigma factor-like helix-turn-helix DNA-binding protein n=1 Tax=Gordonia sp. (in: high G+C Gram-positive bacteria) TaxID=84139 RepID=UPI0039E4D3F3